MYDGNKISVHIAENKSIFLFLNHNMSQQISMIVTRCGTGLKIVVEAICHLYHMNGIQKKAVNHITENIYGTSCFL
jgi:hypothetical protein